MIQGRKHFKLGNIPAYKESKGISNEVWRTVSSWKYLERNTLGAQLIRAIDSIAANIAEGFGRFHKKDKIKFYYNSRASVYETAHWINLSFERGLIKEAVKEKWLEILRKLPKQINTLIKITSENLKQ